MIFTKKAQICWGIYDLQSKFLKIIKNKFTKYDPVNIYENIWAPKAQLFWFLSAKMSFEKLELKTAKTQT